MTLAEYFNHPALPVLTFVLGLFVGHRLALWRDLRKEFNDAATPVRRWLLGQGSSPNPYQGSVSIEVLDAFEQRLSQRQRKAFRACLADYKQATKQQTDADAVGQRFYKSTVEIQAALQAMLPFTDPR